MHISEGVLDPAICIAGYAAAAGMSALALRKIRRKDIPKISVMGACFFVSSLIHIKVGITSVHLSLLGIVGVVLGLQSVLAIFVGLFFQAIMFQHGGLSTLGVNTVIMGVSALFAYGGFTVATKTWTDRRNLLSLAGGLASALAIVLGAFFMLLIILITGMELRGFAVIFSASNAVLAAVEGVVAFFVIHQIQRLKPEMLRSFARDDIDS